MDDGVSMIEVTQLSYTYPQRSNPALLDVDLHVDRAEMLLVAGRSGCGKSTLLRAFNGLVPRFYGGHFAGRVVVDGLDTRKAEPGVMAGKAGLVFQEPEGRFVTCNVADEIAFGLEVAGLPSRVIRDRVDEILDRFELGALVNRPLERLSAGEQQRVAVAAALARMPVVLLLDEPTSQLDSHSAGAVLEWVAELRGTLGLTAIVAEHRLERLLTAADRLVWLPDRPGGATVGEPTRLAACMPHGPALFEAARRLGCPPPLAEPARELLRQQIVSMESPVPILPPSGRPLLAARGLTFAYNGIPALQAAELEVHAGEMVAVLGRNGSGKTTLLRCLMGLLRASSGEVWLAEERIDSWPVPDRARQMGYVPQWPSGLLFAESVREELLITLRNHGLEGHPPVQPDSLLEELGLLRVADCYPRDLSAGERQRAALAAVLVTRPKVILLDEPTLGIDPLAQAEIGGILRRWRAEGAAIVVATHDVEFAARYADRAAVLERGRVVRRGPTAETLFAHPELRTSLQRLTERARPASVDELPPARDELGGGHAID